MSKFQVLEDIYRYASDLTPAEFRVLVVLVTYTDENCGNAHPSAVRLAEEVGTDAANVRKRLKRLEALGYVVKTEDGGNQYGHGKANVYRVQVPAQARARAEELRVKRSGEATPVEGCQEDPPRVLSQPAKVGCEDTPSGPLPGPVSGHESSSVESSIPPLESFAVEAALPPTPLRPKKKRQGPVEQWGRFKGHADYAAILGAYADAARWGALRDWDKAVDADGLFWGHLLEVTDLDDIGFPMDEWTIRTRVRTREDVGAQVGKLLNAAADLKGSPLTWRPHGALLNPHPLPRKRLVA